MTAELRRTGIPVAGNVPWGTHFSLFCETQQDLLDTLVPYFKAGLESNEFCVWVISPPLTEEVTQSALRQAIPDLDRYLAQHSIEILSHEQWYLQNGIFDLRRVLRGWEQKLNQVIANGYDGLRGIGNVDWLTDKYSNDFAEYEQELDRWIANKRMIAVCTYPLAAINGSHIFEVAHAHQFVVARRHGKWESLETPELVQAKAEVQRLNQELEQRVVERTSQLAATNKELEKQVAERKRAEADLGRSGSNFRILADKSLQGIQIFQGQKIVYANPAMATITGYSVQEQMTMSPEALWARVHPEDRAIAEERRRRRRAGEALSPSVELRILHKDGSTRWIQSFNNPIEYNGQPAILSATIDISERKRSEAELRLHAARMEAFTKITDAFAEAGLDYQRVLSAVAQRTAKSIGDACVITLFSGDGTRSYTVAFYHPDPQALALMREALTLDWQGGTDTRRFQVLLSGGSIYLPVVDQKEFRAASEPEFWHYIDEIGVASVLIVPLRVQGRVIGTLGITRDQPGRPYTLNDQVLLQDLADRAALIIQNAQLFDQVQSGQQRLQTLSNQLLVAQESERRSIARELHDQIGQVLTAVNVDLQAFQLSTDDPAQARRLEASLDLVGEAINQVRDLSLDLRPAVLDAYGLGPALEWYLDRQAQRFGFRTELAVKPTGLRLPSDLETTLFRVAQIVLANVERHAHAKRVYVELSQHDGHVELLIRDDGIGFDVPAALERAARGGTLGLLSLQERVQLTGGTVEINSAPGHGTEIRAWFPLDQE